MIDPELSRQMLLAYYTVLDPKKNAANMGNWNRELKRLSQNKFDF
jgi:hypothetical protein